MDRLSDGVIAISPYLYSFYKNKGVRAYLLPPVFDNICGEIEHIDSQTINIIYAGSLNGQKDFILPFLAGVDEYNKKHGVRFELHIIGTVSDEKLKKLNYYKCGVHLHGELSHENVRKMMKISHFGILLRNKRKYAKAGFSTKFAEMMSSGISMICTKVGGADTLIEDGKNGFLLENNDVDDVLKVLERISRLSYGELECIRNNALLTAKKHFDMNNYIESFGRFLE